MTSLCVASHKIGGWPQCCTVHVSAPISKQQRSDSGSYLQDAQSSVRALSNPSTNTISEYSSYDAVGNAARVTDFNGKTTTYHYDALNRLDTISPDASLNQPSILFTFTPTGQRASMSDGSGTTTYGYDAQDRLTSKATPQGRCV